MFPPGMGDDLEVEATEPDYMDEEIEIRLSGNRRFVLSVISTLHVGSHVVTEVPPPVPTPHAQDSQEMMAAISHDVFEDVVDQGIDPERAMEDGGVWMRGDDVEDLIDVEVLEG